MKQHKEEIFQFHTFFMMICKSVMISNIAVSDENSMVESLLSLLGHLGILTNNCDVVDSSKNSRRSSNQQEQQ
jgi:hypothetical protein